MKKKLKFQLQALIIKQFWGLLPLGVVLLVFSPEILLMKRVELWIDFIVVKFWGHKKYLYNADLFF